MKNEKELNDDILKLTMKIQNTRPELSKFISEMPIIKTGLDGEEVKAQNLRDYYNSLEALLNNYNITHGDATEIES
jgi:hypothetical protein